ncbi:hypothetical protein J7K24_00205 [bacterium]|nr:hypothetical protein [bacterium]
MKFSDKISKLPLKTRKIILWIIVITVGIVLVYFWTKYSIRSLKETWQPGELEQQFKISELKEKLREGFPELKRMQSLLKSWSNPQNFSPNILGSTSSDVNFPNENFPNFQK